ncbi:MAG: SsrA-binding protein SmpB [Candidatus Marinimicrobia bacterium]|nr:SsrA-binding protein SmpB [Candidatus Neomarinimicrobiota bacterium]
MNEKIIATNRKAYHEFFILDKFEAGIELLGSEVKSLREGSGNLKEGYVVIREGNAVLIGVHISPYSHTGFTGHDPLRDRQLLLNKKEIIKLVKKVSEKGLTLIPLRMYFKNGWVKVEIGLAKGKHHYDKKDSIKKRDIKRETEREVRKH